MEWECIGSTGSRFDTDDRTIKAMLARPDLALSGAIEIFLHDSCNQIIPSENFWKARRPAHQFIGTRIEAEK